jgi:hypothetical protein
MKQNNDGVIKIQLQCSQRNKFTITKATDTNDGGRAFDASVHLLSRALVSQSASESWCIKYSVTSSVKQTPFVS